MVWGLIGGCGNGGVFGWGWVEGVWVDGVGVNWGV